MRQRLRELVQSRGFELFSQSVILVSLLTFTVATLPDQSKALQGVLFRIEAATVAVFTVEYLARLVAATSPLRFAFSPLGLIDLVAVLPFYLAMGIDLRVVRTVRFVRVFRLLKMLRYQRAVSRLVRTFNEVKTEVVLFLVASCILLYLAAVGIYYCERDAQPEAFASVLHSLWWAVATLTTVGYGDVYPVTLAGKLFTGIILLIGLGVVAVPSGLIASAMTRTLEEEKKQSATFNDGSCGRGASLSSPTSKER